MAAGSLGKEQVELDVGTERGRQVERKKPGPV